MRIPWAVSSIVAAVVLLGRAQQQAENKSLVKLFWDVPSEVGLHEPVVAKAVLINDSYVDVSFDLGFDQFGNFAFDLTKPTGSHQHAKPTPKDGGATPPVVTLLAQGRQPQSTPSLPDSAWATSSPHVVRRILNEWLEFSEPGSYSLRIGFLGSVRPVPSPTSGIEFDRTIKITVRPRDDSALRQYCQQQLQALSSDSYDERSFAVRKLRYVIDPVAIPFLALGVAYKYEGLQLLNTLAAIGTPEARQVVERFTTDADPDVVRAAKDALARFPGRSQSRFER
jgi:hypothetical protein